MKKKLDIMFTKGLAKVIYAVEFTKNPYRCIERLGTKAEMLDRVEKEIELRYAE